MSVLLERVGDVARERGRWEEAEGAYRENAQVSNALRDRLGDSPQVLDDLARAQIRLGRLLLATGRAAEAQRHIREAEALLDRLSLVYPERPEYEARLKDVKSLLDGVSASE